MKTRKLIAMSLVLAMVLSMVAMIGPLSLTVKAAEGNVVIADDFSGETSIFGENASIANGEATITKGGGMFQVFFPEDKILESNN